MSPSELTSINLIGIGFILVMGFLLIFLPRHLAVLPILITACFMTLGQRINIAGINFYVLRIIILISWFRLIIRNEISSLQLNTIDKILILWIISNIFFYTISRHSSQAFINRLGFAFNAIGLYFLFRSLILDCRDIDRIFKILGIVSVFFTITILFEYITGKNLFSIFGGVQKEFELAQIRYGRIRCMGPFRSPILTGTFGALLVPLSVILWFNLDKTKILSIIVFICGTFITIASGSSGPIITYICLIGVLFLWHFHTHIKAIIWGSLGLIIALHLYMKAPVWFLIARISRFVGGGTGWHRAILIDKAIKHFDEWWLVGTDYTVHWTERAIEANPHMADITNQYIQQGVDGGLLTMILFILVIVLCFRSIGNALRIMEKQPLPIRITLWSMGSMLFGHAVTFFSVTYFDQMIVIWYLLLAMISSVDSLCQTFNTQEVYPSEMTKNT